MLRLRNKEPEWSDELGAYTLEYNGRATLASVKNIQWSPPTRRSRAGTPSSCFQLGKVSDDRFNVDWKAPLSAMQAFGVVGSAFDAVLACAPAPPALRAERSPRAGSFRRGARKPAARSSTPPPPDASPLAPPARLDGESLRLEPSMESSEVGDYGAVTPRERSSDYSRSIAKCPFDPSARGVAPPRPLHARCPESPRRLERHSVPQV